MELRDLNALGDEVAAREFRRCCGSSRWAQAMAAARPFASSDAMMAAADSIWIGLDRGDWLEAFAAHPPIGSNSGSGGSDRPGGDSTGGDAVWSAAEQAGVSSASADLLARLAEANSEYEARFGFIFIVCATGKSADEMLGLLQRRLDNDPAIEVRIAADEQRKITRVRLDKLLDARVSITTHVLDTARGCPAAGVHVRLERSDDDAWTATGEGATDANGRLTTLTQGQSVAAGTYRLTFDTGRYHRAHGVTPFFPDVQITFVVDDERGHYHVPLLLSPFGFSTYRGS
jgi:hydroxyisourate hydrolase